MGMFLFSDVSRFPSYRMSVIKRFYCIKIEFKYRRHRTDGHDLGGRNIIQDVLKIFIRVQLKGFWYMRVIK